MKIEIWSDFTCPLCYIGKRKLELALDQFENRQYVKLEFKSYQFNVNNEKVFASELYEQAARVGLTFQLDKALNTNTFHAHRLVKYAHKSGKETALIELLFQKHFTYNENIGEKGVLKALAQEINLNEEEVDELLALNKYAKAVNSDEDLAREIGIENVPFFVINEKYAISGAQPSEVFLDVLEQVWVEERDKLLHVTNIGVNKSYCDGNDCE